MNEHRAHFSGFTAVPTPQETRNGMGMGPMLETSRRRLLQLQRRAWLEAIWISLVFGALFGFVIGWSVASLVMRP